MAKISIFLLGKIIFVGGNSPFPILLFSNYTHLIMHGVNWKSMISLYLCPFLSSRKLNLTIFWNGLQPYIS